MAGIFYGFFPRYRGGSLYRRIKKISKAVAGCIIISRPVPLISWHYKYALYKKLRFAHPRFASDEGRFSGHHEYRKKMEYAPPDWGFILHQFVTIFDSR